VIVQAYRLAVYDGTDHIGASSPFPTEDSALEEAKMYLIMNPADVVMLVPVEMGICKHCDEHIVEKMGWVLHKWIHLRTGTFMCWLKMTQAEPKEEM
jgi:hypothetical protein